MKERSWANYRAAHLRPATMRDHLCVWFANALFVLPLHFCSNQRMLWAVKDVHYPDGSISSPNEVIMAVMNACYAIKCAHCNCFSHSVHAGHDCSLRQSISPSHPNSILHCMWLACGGMHNPHSLPPPKLHLSKQQQQNPESKANYLLDECCLLVIYHCDDALI